MPTLQQKKEIKQVYKIENFLIPITTMVFSKKTNSKEESEENSLDFHLNIINKIDKLLEEHEDKTLSTDSITEEQINNFSDDSYVEIRSPLNKRIIPPESKLEGKSGHIVPNIEITPEKFKTDLSENPVQIKENIHIEIIDIGDKSIRDVPTKKKSVIIKNGIHKFKHKINQKSEQKFKPQDITTKKVVVIDTKELSNKNQKKIWNKKLKKTNETEKKAKLFFITSKNQQKESKSIEPNSEGLYLPKNFGKKLKHFEEKEEVIQKRKKKEFTKKQKESEKLIKLKAKKTLLEAREKEKLARNAEKERKKNLVLEQKKERSKNIEINKQKAVIPKKSTSEVEKLTEWKSYDAEGEISPNGPLLKENIQEKKSLNIDQKKLFQKQLNEEKIAEKEKQEELKKLIREKKIKEKEEKKTKKLEAKKTLLEAREKEKLARNAEKERKKNLVLEQKKERAKEREAEKAKKIAIKKQKSRQKEKKPLILFKREKNKLQFENHKKHLKDEKNALDIKEQDKKEEQGEPKEKSEPTFLDEDIKKLLIITDDLLGKLPEEVIDEFSKSEDFELYSKIFSKYKIK